MNKTIVGCLQNMWFLPHVPEESCRNPKFWHRAFCQCRSGRRLAACLGQDLFKSFVWENASPKIGRHSGASFPADHAHIKKWLTEQKPDVVVTFGVNAEKALKQLWAGPLVCVPHPAYRVVTNQLFEHLRHILTEPSMKRMRVALRQERGDVRWEHLGESVISMRNRRKKTA